MYFVCGGVVLICIAFAGCDTYCMSISSRGSVSIHTALAGCDSNGRARERQNADVSIHTALAGCDHK